MEGDSPIASGAILNDEEDGIALNLAASSPSYQQRRRFTEELDFFLLKEAILAGAHIPPHGKQQEYFKEVAKALNNTNVLPWKTDYKHFLDRYRLILTAYQISDRHKASSSGIEEEFGQREQLLEDIRNLVDDEKDRRKQSREAEANKEVELVAAGVRVREQAMAKPLRGSSRSDSTADSQDKERNGSGNKKRKTYKAEENEEKEEFFELEYKRV